VAWTLKRLAISAFVALHLSAVLLWNLPASALKERLAGWTAFYIMPTGQCQAWNMFSPDPLKDNLALRAVVRDRFGLRRNFDFPCNADLSPWQAVVAYRHPKYAAELNVPTAVAQREYAARYVLRKVGLPPNAYPADVELYYDLRPTPAPGEPPLDPMEPPLHLTLQSYRFPTFEEAQP
jgi:hypothetical protein